MSYITARDGTEIFYKDWGPRDAPTLMFHHGWPLSSDDWDAQIMFFLNEGFRVIAHDRRGHGRSSLTWTGNDMDTYASDVAELAAALDLRNAVHIGHSTGGGEVARYVARAEKGRVAKAVLIGAVPPIMVKSASNPNGVPIEGFKDHSLLTIGGVRIGLTGLAYENSARMSSPEDLQFLPTIAVTKAQSELLRKEGADFVIGVLHCDRGDAIALQYARAAELLLTGHTHDLFVNFDGLNAIVESGYDAHYVTMVDLDIVVRERGVGFLARLAGEPLAPHIGLCHELNVIFISHDNFPAQVFIPFEAVEPGQRLRRHVEIQYARHHRARFGDDARIADTGHGIARVTVEARRKRNARLPRDTQPDFGKHQRSVSEDMHLPALTAGPSTDAGRSDRASGR